MSRVALPGILASTFGTGPPPLDIWANVVSLLDFEGSDGATTTVDRKGLPWTFHGDAQIDDGVVLEEAASLLLGGTGYLTQGVVGDWNFLHNGLQSYTVEISCRLVDTGTTHMLIDTGGGASINVGLSLGVQSDGSVKIWIGRGQAGFFAAEVTSAPGLVSFGATTQLALEYSLTSGLVRVYVDGTTIMSSTLFSPATANHQLPFNLGRFAVTNGFYTVGSLDEFRVTLLALYEGDYAPATGPFPES